MRNAHFTPVKHPHSPRDPASAPRFIYLSEVQLAVLGDIYKNAGIYSSCVFSASKKCKFLRKRFFINVKKKPSYIDMLDRLKTMWYLFLDCRCPASLLPESRRTERKEKKKEKEEENNRKQSLRCLKPSPNTSLDRIY